MFDIGFWEIMVISVLGLIVLGPERLPTAIRSVISWVTTAKNMANSVKTEISQELKIHEMNENMIKATKKGLSDLDPDLQKSINEMKQAAADVTRPYMNAQEDLSQTIKADPTENKELDTPPKTQDKSE